MTVQKWLTLGICVCVFGVNVVIAQDSLDDDEIDRTCNALVDTALEAIGNACGDLGRNEACYGNFNVQAVDFDDAPITDFDDSGDVTPISTIATITTAPLNIEDEIWGVAVLNLQANLPDTLPGQNVTFLIFGDAQINADDDAPDGFGAPMQAFRLSTGVGQVTCGDVPRDGVMVQSPQGTTVNFLINGVEVEMGSTVYLAVNEDEALVVSVVEGHATVTSDGESQTAGAGEQITVTEGQPPSEPQSMTSNQYGNVIILLPLLPGGEGALVLLDGTNDAWLDTGVTLNTGDTVQIVAGGHIDIWPDCEIIDTDIPCETMRFGPNGSDGIGPADPSYYLGGVNVGALVGRVGDGDSFFIGTGGEFTASSTGTLQIVMNDTMFMDDNVGRFIVFIRPTGAP